MTGVTSLKKTICFEKTTRDQISPTKDRFSCTTKVIKTHVKNDLALRFATMECYATPWGLWRESRILWHIVETSLTFFATLSHSPSLIALSFLSLGG